MFNPFPFIFIILELEFFLTVTHWGHEAKHKFLKKMLHIGDNVAHWGVAHWVHPVYFLNNFKLKKLKIDTVFFWRLHSYSFWLIIGWTATMTFKICTCNITLCWLNDWELNSCLQIEHIKKQTDQKDELIHYFHSGNEKTVKNNTFLLSYYARINDMICSRRDVGVL